jgi:hypothetical protein
MQTDTTRRAVLRLGTGALACGAGAAAVAGGAGLAGEAKGVSPTVDRHAFNRALAAYRAAVKASDDHYRLVEEPAEDEVQRRAPFLSCTFYHTASSGKTVGHRWNANDPDGWECGPPNSILAQKARAVRTAYEANQRVREQLGMAAIGDESDRLYRAINPAEDVLFATPAPDLAAVQIKLDLLWKDDRDQIPAYQDLVMADVRRLSGGEA